MSKLDDFLKFTSSPEGSKFFQAALPGAIRLRDMGPYALSRMTDLAGTAATFPHGEIRVTLSGVSVSPCAVEGRTGEVIDEKRVRVTLSLSAMDLRSQYALSALEQPKVDLDTGGGLRLISDLAAKDDGDPDSLTDKQFDQLQQADQERDNLNETTNGQTLVSMFKEYNDAYNEVFQTNPALQRAWKRYGATREVMDHTSAALKTNQPINPSDKTFGTNHETYNHVAFSKQASVAIACATPFPNAAKACANFSIQVSDTTGNTQSDPKPLTRSDVYSHVAKPKGTPSGSFGVAGAAVNRRPRLPPAEVIGILHRIGSGAHADSDIEAMRSVGYLMRDTDIADLQEIYKDSLRVPGAEVSAELWQGSAEATVPASRFVFVFTLRGNGAITTELKSTSMPLPELRIDDAAWSGEAGAVARTRLQSAHFIRALIHDRMADAIERAVEAKVSAWSP